MRTGRGEALDIFRRWREEEALLRCALSFSSLAACFVGRLDVVEDARLHLLSGDGTSELELPLRAELEFGYGDPRNFPEEAAVFEDALVLFFPNGDTLSFASLKS